MDQSHGDGNGGWDPNNFMASNNEWDHHQYGGFDLHNTGGETNYSNEFLSGGSITQQLPVPNAEFRNFDTFEQGNNVWSGTGHVLPPHGHNQPQPSYTQDPALDPRFYQEQLHQQHSHPHQTDPNSTVTSRFALEASHSGDFPSHLHAANDQETVHAFGSDVVNVSGSTQNGFAHSHVAVPQWSARMQTGYGAGPHQYENPLAASAVQQTGSPFTSHRPVQTYQIEAPRHQPVNSQQMHTPFTTAPNGQPQQTHLSTGQSSAPITGSPHASVQKKAAPQQPLPQQQPQRLPQQSQQQVLQPVISQHNFPEQTASQTSHQQSLPAAQAPQKQAAQQLTFSPNVNVSAPQALAKKARAVASASPLQASQQGQQTPSQPAVQFRYTAAPDIPKSANGINHTNHQLLQSPQAVNGPKWAGSTHLVFGSAPTRLQQSGTPTKRYVMLSTKNDKPPLFPDSNIGWIAAESLGHHLHAYQAATSDAERYQADVRLDIEMSRSGNEIPADWWKKLVKANVDTARVPAPPEPEKTAIIAREKVRLHPAHVGNPIHIQRVYIDYGSFLSDKARDLLKAMKARADGNEAVEAEETDLKLQLERAIVEGLKHGHPTVLSKLAGKEKALLPALLGRVLGKLATNEASSSLSKTILQLFVQFTSVTVKQLEVFKMTVIKEKLKKRGDDEVIALVDQIFKIAEENAGDSSDASSKAKEPIKKTSKQAQALGTSKPTATAATSTDSKKSTAALTTRTNRSVSDSKTSSAPASSKMVSTTEPKKLATKAAQKLSSTSSSSTGMKRSREDDPAGDARSSKKPANEGSLSASTNVMNSKPSTYSSLLNRTTGTTKATIAKSSTATTPSSSSSATAAAKPKSSLLLPGKSRPIAKPVSKNDAEKPDVKVAPKTEPAAKSQPTKTSSQTASAVSRVIKSKSTEAPKETGSTRSAFSALMDEIHQPKKVNTPVVPTKAEPEIDHNETPEQRKRRLRKEHRRSQNLKVTWKVGDALVEIREFTRDPEEIAQQGKAFGSVKIDARNKFNDEASHFRKVNSRMGIKSIEIGDREWETPIPIKFAHIPREKRREIYETHGGLKRVESKEQKIIQERENNELMVIYHTLDDVPATPRSPQYEPSNNLPVYGYQGIPQTTPNYDEIMKRMREVRAWGTAQASRIAIARLEARDRVQVSPPTSDVITDNNVWFNPAQAARRDQATWDLLTSQCLRNWGDLHPNYPYSPDTPRPKDEAAWKDPEFVKALGHIQAVIDSLKLQQEQKATAAAVPAPAQPVFPALASVVPQVTAAVAAVQAAAPAPDYSAAWAQYYAQQHQQQQQQQAWAGHQQNAYTQAANPYVQQEQPAQPQQTADINSLLAQLGSQSAASQPQQTAPATQNPQLQALLAALGGGAVPAPVQAAVAPEAQNAQYLLDMLKWSQGQGQAHGQVPTTTTAPSPSIYGSNSQPASSSYQAREPTHERYNSSQSYGNDRNERPSKPAPDYGAMYDDDTYAQPQQNNNYRERDDNVNGFPGGGNRRDRDRDYHGGGGHKKHKKNKGGGGGGGHGGNNGGNNSGDKDNELPDHLRGINRSLIGTKQCAFWAKGTCAKGDKCTFRHD
ncbi:hypothetical protein QBC38DRAFT_97793 [Podospora fimiseda]|uniref:C3H1-type domain-containing protein n=1 Tax=Podospora fimiseda TaxID=252190 RepID=A0AAN7BUC2_9PEZI|nr:hypothetical protein QBC38DRAFT_97793 [Podospora fimiseda]